MRVDPHDLHDRVVLVTGAGRGIGRAIALHAARAGCRVAALSRSRDEVDATVDLISQSGGEAVALSTSVTDPAGVAGAIDRVLRRFGSIDVLVNNAGSIGPLGPFSETDLNDWWAAMDVNLRGTVICTRTVLPSMLARRTGRIINISSGGAATGMTYFSSYIVAKTAVLRLTECIAPELRPYGLSVFAVGPGTVRTTMSERSLTSESGRRWLPWFRRIFDEGFDVSADVPAMLVMALATGRYDALSGRFITVADDLDQLLASTDRIDRDELYALRVNRLPASGSAPALRAIAAAATAPSGLTLRLERTLPLALEDAFAAWVEPTAIARWFVHAADVQWMRPPEVDARAGHGFRFCVAGAKGMFDFTGTYRELRRPTRLQFTWRWETLPIIEGPGDTSVTVEFAESAGTHITVVQDHLPHSQALEAHRRGWERCLDGLALLSRRG